MTLVTILLPKNISDCLDLTTKNIIKKRICEKISEVLKVKPEDIIFLWNIARFVSNSTGLWVEIICETNGYYRPITEETIEKILEAVSEYLSTTPFLGDTSVKEIVVWVKPCFNVGITATKRIKRAAPAVLQATKGAKEP